MIEILLLLGALFVFGLMLRAIVDAVTLVRRRRRPTKGRRAA